MQNPTNTRKTSRVSYEGRKAYTGETADWLREMPSPVDDTQSRFIFPCVKDFDVSRLDVFTDVSDKPVPSDVNATEWLQTNLTGLVDAQSAYNASGQVVMKFTPKHLQAGRAFI